MPASGLPDHWFTFLEQIQQVPDRVMSFDQAMGFFKSVSEIFVLCHATSGTCTLHMCLASESKAGDGSDHPHRLNMVT